MNTWLELLLHNLELYHLITSFVLWLALGRAYNFLLLLCYLVASMFELLMLEFRFYISRVLSFSGFLISLLNTILNSEHIKFLLNWFSFDNAVDVSLGQGKNTWKVWSTYHWKDRATMGTVTHMVSASRPFPIEMVSVRSSNPLSDSLKIHLRDRWYEKTTPICVLIKYDSRP